MSKNTMGLLNKGLTLFKKQNYEQALDQFEQILKADPKHEMALIHKGMCLFKFGEYKKAISFLRIMDYFGPEPATLGAYIECLLAIGEVKEAEMKFKSMDPYFEGEPEWEDVKCKIMLAKKSATKTSRHTEPKEELEAEWLKEIDNFLIQFTHQTKKKAGAIVIEWNQQNRNEVQLHFIALAYQEATDFEKLFKKYMTIDNMIGKEYSTSVSKVIKEKKRFTKLMSAACELPSFKAVKKQDPFYFIQQEHDTKVDFYFRHYCI